MNNILDEFDMDNSLEDEMLLNDSIDEGDQINDSMEFNKGLVGLKNNDINIDTNSNLLSTPRNQQGIQIYKIKLKRMALRVQQAESMLEKNLEMLRRCWGRQPRRR